MPPFLGQEWLSELVARAERLPEVAGTSIVCQHEISGTPEGKVRFFLVWDDGRLVEAALGKHSSPDTMFTATAEDALDVLRGGTEPEVAFMQGRLKIDGDYKLWLVDFAEWRRSEPLRSLAREMAEISE